MQSGSEPALKQLVDSLQLTGDGKTITVQFSLPTEAFEALEQMGKPRPRGERDRQPQDQ